MDPVTGALVAAAVGWASILAVVKLPVTRLVPPERLRVVGAVTLGVVGLSALGLPVPRTSPLGLMVLGMVGAAVERPLRGGVDLARLRDVQLPGCQLADPDVPSPGRRIHPDVGDDVAAAAGGVSETVSEPSQWTVGTLGGPMPSRGSPRPMRAVNC